MKNAEINPGRLCNNRCVFCMSGNERDRKDPWVPLDTMREEMRRHFDAGARSLGFLGGEPTVYPHIVECVRLAREMGYERISLCTNGTRLSDRAFLDRLIAAGVTRVTVSMHSHLPEVEDALTRVPGNWERKMAALGHLVSLKRAGALKDNLSLNPVLCRPNMRGLEDYVRFFVGEGVDDFRFNFIWPQGLAERDESVVPRFREAVPWMLKLVRFNEREGRLHLSFGGVPYCVLPAAFQDKWPVLAKYFHEEGHDLPTDVSFLRPEGRGESERFNWQERSRDDYRGRVEACRECRFLDKCMGVYRSYLELYGDEEFGKDQPA